MLWYSRDYDGILLSQAETFANLLTSESGDSSDDKAIAAMGILNTLDTIVGVLEEHKEVCIICATIT